MMFESAAKVYGGRAEVDEYCWACAKIKRSG
jgi:hypothetical protein